uniref:Polarized growth chromatin-associated controller 1 n=1 Tax=Anthurium amnicola TaxID=1678845 RepID=A0A1D1YSE5_9ARAE
MEDPAVSAVEDCPGWDFTCDLEVDYESELHASIVCAALAVDKELQPDKVKRQMSVCNGRLSVHFEAVEARFLRASFSSFVDLVTIATKTIEEFDMGDASLIAENM